MKNSLSVAKKILELADTKDTSFTPMQLLKLVYLSHAWMLGLYGKHLISDNVEAWKYGPIIPELYNKIKHYRSNPVESIASSETVEFNECEISILKQVCEKYGGFSGPKLSRLTHEKGSPWEKTWKKGKTIISNDLIMDYYQNLAQNNE